MKMGELLNHAAAELCQFLENRLPTPGDKDWWVKRVVDKLSFQQQRYVEQRGVSELGGLDLAALIRILDQNWYDLNWKESFPPDARHFVKEMQTIRNRWAHTSLQEYPREDVYRDIDTLQRFLAVIGASEGLQNKVRAERQKLVEPAQPAVEGTAGTKTAGAEGQDEGLAFQPTHIVQLRSDSSKRGPVLAVQELETENRYQVFMEGASKWFYESQLEAVSHEGENQVLVPLDQFHAHLTALQIQHPSLSILYSLNAARVDFIPYQFRPVLKFIRADRPRLLIADGVGVGKTIEAGLILRELQARREVRSVLIICPRPLVTERKWLMEMKRFEERFTQLDGNTLRYCISETDLEGEWPEQHAKTILPYSLFDEVQLHGSQATGSSRREKGQRGLLDLDPPPRFDLVIVDEAHHVRNPHTYSHEAVRLFCDNAEAVVFLTATPLMLGSGDLFVLLNLLRPDLIIDQESFQQMAAPNPHINYAIDVARGGAGGWQQEAISALDDAAHTDWGSRIMAQDPEFRSVKKELVDKSLSPEGRVSAIHRLEGLHTFSGIINRTRRRDIGEFTVREPKTVSVEFTPRQRDLHDSLLEVQAQILSKLHPTININFMMTTIRRQAASCLYGLAPLIKDILHRRIADVGAQEPGDEYELLAPEVAGEVRGEVEGIVKRAEQLGGTKDPKLEALQGIIRDKQALENNKLMVFSSFRHTLSYLFVKLLATGIRVGLVHGGTPDEERVALRDRFKRLREDAEAIDVLLFSEVGCEGLDYQFCDCIVNYDIPWNPMRVEQRIGRIDRKGQKSEKVLIYNLITPNTVDADIYERCLLRIGVFNSALGASEEILGDLAQAIRSVAEDVQLSDTERKEKLQQISDNQIRLIQEQQVLEDKQAELFGIRLPADQAQKDIEGASSFWLSPVAVQNLVKCYLQGISEKTQEYILGEKATKTLRVSQDGRARLLKDYQALPRVASPTCRQWENWLKSGDSRLAITFDAQEAVENQGAAFITPLHPLVRQAASAMEPGARKPICVVQAVDADIPPGQHPFVIYEWRYSGVREDLVLYPVARSPEVTLRISSLLEYGRPGSLPDDQAPEQAVFDQLDAVHYKLWAKARLDHKEQNQRIADYRRESLTASHRGRVVMLKDMLAQATNEKIRRMRQSQLGNAEADYRRRLAELDEAVKKADLNAEPVAYGVVILAREEGDAW